MSVNFNNNAELEPLIRSSHGPDGPRRSVWLAVELPLFLLLFSSSLTDTVTYNLLLYRTCIIELDHNSTKCALLNILNKTGEAKDLETEVQSEASILVTTISVFSSIMPAILAVFLGSWSDKYGRKPLVVWPLFGQFVTAVLTVVFSAEQSLSAYWFILCIMPLAMLGGFSTIMLGANLITTDITTEEDRTFRLALIQGCGFAGVLTGTIASSYVYDFMGYVPLFTLSAAIYFFTLLYTIVLVEETLVIAERGGLCKIFNCDLIKDMGRTCFKKRDLRITAILTLLITAFGITMFCIFGISAVDYLFTRQKFQWLLKEYSTFCAVNIIIGLMGMYIGMSFFQSYCKMSDGMLLILSYVSSICDATGRSLSQKSWHLYLAGMMSILGSLSPPLIRSQISKVLPKDEVAKMYSLVSCVEAAMPIFAPVLFNWAYYCTLAVFPGFIYVISGGLFMVCLILVINANILYYRVVKNRSQINPLLEEDVCTEN
ncbi:probable peptidoglycan muropeptide transporter SLC46 [Cydia strobilella]|uniref:probable peptidoglycan muropeptide transporter SLC46 n=1 Tax=Cydia strobilella TaxID=1100964 RepID=UPI0030056F1C